MIEDTKPDPAPLTDPAQDLPGVLRAEVDPENYSALIATLQDKGKTCVIVGELDAPAAAEGETVFCL